MLRLPRAYSLKWTLAGLARRADSDSHCESPAGTMVRPDSELANTMLSPSPNGSWRVDETYISTSPGNRMITAGQLQSTMADRWLEMIRRSSHRPDPAAPMLEVERAC